MEVFGSLTHLGDVNVLAIAALAGTLILLALRRARAAMVFVLVAVAGLVVSDGTKAWVQRHRPEWGPLAGHTNSFPSGHALGSTTVYGAWAALLARRTARRGMFWTLLLAATLVVLVVGTSRVYIGVHYPLDVLGGWCAGIGLVLIGTWADGKWSRRRSAAAAALNSP